MRNNWSKKENKYQIIASTKIKRKKSGPKKNEFKKDQSRYNDSRDEDFSTDQNYLPSKQN